MQHPRPTRFFRGLVIASFIMTPFWAVIILIGSLFLRTSPSATQTTMIASGARPEMGSLSYAQPMAAAHENALKLRRIAR